MRKLFQRIAPALMLIFASLFVSGCTTPTMIPASKACPISRDEKLKRSTAERMAAFNDTYVVKP